MLERVICLSGACALSEASLAASTILSGAVVAFSNHEGGIYHADYLSGVRTGEVSVFVSYHLLFH